MTTPKTILQTFGMLAVNAHTQSTYPPADDLVNPDLIIGLELEIENLPLGLRAYQDMVEDFWLVDEDGSLRPRGESWEFISVPAHMKNAIPEMEGLFKRMKVGPDNYSDRCSVHVHTNVQDFTQDQLLNLALVYPVFEEVIFQFINHHGKLEEQGYCRDTNLYCIPWSACRLNKQFAFNLLQGGEQYAVRNWQKYTALNLIPMMDKGTVEWRHMHGTCDMEKLTIWLNIIGGIMGYAKRTSLEETQRVLQVMNDVSTYQQFFEEVLRGALPYNDSYRAMLREGVVNAKYSLINYEENKGKPKKAKAASIYGDDPFERMRVETAEARARFSAAELQRQFIPATARLNPRERPDEGWVLNLFADTPPQPAPAPEAVQRRREHDAITAGNRPAPRRPR